MEVFHLAATLFRSMMKKTVDASIIAVASQNETPTMSVSSSLAPSADTAPRVIRNSIPVNSRLLLFEISVFMVLKQCYPQNQYIKECIFAKFFMRILTIIGPRRSARTRAECTLR